MINIRSVSSFLNMSVDELRTKEDYLPEHRDEYLNMNVGSCAEGHLVLPNPLFAGVFDYPSMYLRRRQVTGLSDKELEEHRGPIATSSCT